MVPPLRLHICCCFQTINFQTVLVTDYTNTYVKMIYEDRAMSWRLGLDTAVLPVNSYPARVGFRVQAETSVLHEDYVYSFLDVSQASNHPHITSIEQIDGVSETQIGGGGWNEQGRFFYALSDHDAATFVHAGKICKDWLVADDLPGRILTPIEPSHAASCPCTLNVLKLLLAKYQRLTHDVIPAGIECYGEVAVAMTPRCCYDGNGLLIADHQQTAGFALYQAFTGAEGEVDISAYEYCCGQENLLSRASSVSLCSSFLGRRPLSTCDSFPTRVSGW